MVLYSALQVYKTALENTRGVCTLGVGGTATRINYDDNDVSPNI